jgi:hypothetical protein
MNTEVLDKLIQAGSVSAQVGAGVSHIKESVGEFIDNELELAKRAAKQGRRKAEDLVDDGRYQIKQRPIGTAAVCFAIGLGFGTIIAILLAPKGRNGK